MSYAKKKETGMVEYLFFLLLLTAYTAVTIFLFSRQVFGTEWYYHSDMKAYILEMQGLESGYSFPYQFFFKFAAFLHLFISTPQMAVATAVTILNSLSVVAVKYYADKTLGPIAKTYGKKSVWISILITLLVFALFLVSMLYEIKFDFTGIWGRYRGVFSPNPYHNATYLATRPFAVVTFFLLAGILENYEKGINKKEVILFGIFLFMTTVTKPSFTFVLVPAAGIIMLYRLISNKFQNWKNTFGLALSFLPTFAALIYQYIGVFGPVEGQETGIGFGLGKAWSFHCGNIVLAILLGLAFPLLVLILHFKDLKKDCIFRLGWQLMAVSMVEILCLFEKGFRMKDLNFSWGYMHGMFFAFVASAFLLFRKTFGKKREELTKKNKILLCVQWAVFGLHLMFGILYFRGLLLGEMYY